MARVLVIEDDADLARNPSVQPRCRRARSPHGLDRQGRAPPRARAAAGPRAPRPDAPRHAGDEGLQAAQGTSADTRDIHGDHGHGEGRGDRPRRRLRARRRRLRRQAVQRARAAPADPGRHAPRRSAAEPASRRSLRLAAASIATRTASGSSDKSDAHGARVQAPAHALRPAATACRRATRCSTTSGASSRTSTTRTVDTHVKRLREKLGSAGDYVRPCAASATGSRGNPEE